jgi:hypothetical protein
MSRNVGRHYAGNVGRYAGRNVRHYAGGYDAGRNVGRYARNYDYGYVGCNNWQALGLRRMASFVLRPGALVQHGTRPSPRRTAH